MAESDVLRQRLAALNKDELAALLHRRLDVLAGPAPRDLGELAHRLWRSYALVDAVRTVGRPHLQVLEAAANLGDGCTTAALADLLAGDGPDQLAAVERVLAELTELAIVTSYADGRVALPAALGELIPDPLRLGQPLVTMLPTLNAAAIRTALARLNRAPKVTKRAALEAELLDFYADTGNVRTLLDSAPETVRTYLADRVGSGDSGIDDYDQDADYGRDDDYDQDDDYGGSRRVYDGSLRFYDPQSYQAERAAERWAAERALVLPARFDYGMYRVPAEVARALRGPDYRAPFVPVAPPVPTRTVDRARVEQATTAAASAVYGHLLTVLDHVARHPLICVKTGGVGARELTKVSKATAVDEATIRLAVECAHDLKLIERDAGTVGVSPHFATWRALEPGQQLASMIRVWWAMGANPTQNRDADGKALRALERADECAGCADARTGMIGVLADLPADAAAERSDVAARTLWRHPFVHIVAADADDPFTTQWCEAELLGVLAEGTLTALGRALFLPPGPSALHDTDPLVVAARAALPAVADRATFGSDLTAYAVGAPSARVTAVLDACADRESSGGAITWRFSPSSVRRALDDGATHDTLLRGLTEIAGDELPQPLRYLIADVARRHGNLRLISAASCVRSEDEALLAEVAADRKLSKLGLRLLAPTVLAADVPVDVLLTSLRAAGYLPVVDTASAADIRAVDVQLAGRQQRAEVAARAEANGYGPQRGGPGSIPPPSRPRCSQVARHRCRCRPTTRC